MRRPEALVTMVLLLLVGLLAGCVNAPSIPNSLEFPDINRPQLMSPVFDTTKYLDCLSAELHSAGADKQKVPVFLTALPNTQGQKVGKVDLPPSLQPFARASLDRISSGFRIMSDEEAAPVRLNGSLYAGSPFRVLNAEFEALGFGVNARVEAIDIALQLYWEVRPQEGPKKGFEQSGTGVTVNLRLYSAEQGSSAFVISAGKNGLVMGHSRASQEVAPHLAIQSAMNVAVVTLLKSMAARQWGVASTCDLGERGRMAIAPDTNVAPSPSIIDVRLALVNGQVCAQVRPRQPGQASLGDERLTLEISEFRAEGILLRRNSINAASLRQLSEPTRSVCLPRGAFDARAEQVQFWFKAADGRVLGGGGYFFQ